MELGSVILVSWKKRHGPHNRRGTGRTKVVGLLRPVRHLRRHVKQNPTVLVVRTRQQFRESPKLAILLAFLVLGRWDFFA